MKKAETTKSNSIARQLTSIVLEEFHRGCEWKKSELDREYQRQKSELDREYQRQKSELERQKSELESMEAKKEDELTQKLLDHKTSLIESDTSLFNLLTSSSHIRGEFINVLRPIICKNNISVRNAIIKTEELIKQDAIHAVYKYDNGEIIPILPIDKIDSSTQTEAYVVDQSMVVSVIGDSYFVQEGNS